MLTILLFSIIASLNNRGSIVYNFYRFFLMKQLFKYFGCGLYSFRVKDFSCYDNFVSNLITYRYYDVFDEIDLPSFNFSIGYNKFKYSGLIQRGYTPALMIDSNNTKLLIRNDSTDFFCVGSELFLNLNCEHTFSKINNEQNWKLLSKFSTTYTQKEYFYNYFYSFSILYTNFSSLNFILTVNISSISSSRQINFTEKTGI